MVQIARPISDVSVGSWTTQAGGTTNLFSTIDEAVASDADFVQSSSSPTSADIYKVRLGGLTDPVSSAGHHVRYRYKKSVSGGDVINLTVRLKQGSTQIWSTTLSDITSSFVDGDVTLSGGEADAITDYTALDVWFESVVANSGFTGSEFRAATTGTGTFPASTAILANKPSGTVDGDLLVACLVVGGAITVTAPAGWTDILGSPVILSTGERLRAYAKIASGEGSTFTWSFSAGDDCSLVVAAYAGTVADATAEATNSGSSSSSTDIVAPSVTTTGADQLVVYFLATANTVTISGAGGSNNLRAETHASQVTAALADEVIAATSAVGTRTFPLGATNKNGAIVVAFSKV